MKVLVIDDDPVNIKLVSIILKSNGYLVLNSVNVNDAFDIIISEKPELIILDLILPDMDGVTFAKKLKSNPVTKDIPIISMTAHPDLFKRAEVIESGCEEYLVKPLDTRHLHEVVENVYHRRN